jgi:isopentenyl-diphosphate delta-isomerase
MEQTLIVVDERDQFLGYASRAECHQGDGKLHRAIAVLLIDSARRVLLQQRRSALWDGVWDLTGATHPLHLADRDEDYQEAARRCLQVEWHIDVPLERVLAFQYFAPWGDHCENEYCVLFVGRVDGSVTLNPDHGYALRWLDIDACLAEIRRAPERFTPWARIALEDLAQHPRFASLLAAS